MTLDGIHDCYLTCLICGERQESIMPEYPCQPALVALKEHLLELHKITQLSVGAREWPLCRDLSRQRRG